MGLLEPVLGKERVDATEGGREPPPQFHFGAPLPLMDSPWAALSLAWPSSAMYLLSSPNRPKRLYWLLQGIQKEFVYLPFCQSKAKQNTLFENANFMEQWLHGCFSCILVARWSPTQNLSLAVSGSIQLYRNKTGGKELKESAGQIKMCVCVCIDTSPFLLSLIHI